MWVKQAWSVGVVVAAVVYAIAPGARADPQATGSVNASCSNSGTQSAGYTIGPSPLPLPQAVSRIVTDGAIQFWYPPGPQPADPETGRGPGAGYNVTLPG